MIVIACRRCSEHPSLPGQRWCRPCFAAYRRQKRARKRDQEGATEDRMSGVVPSINVKIYPYNFLLRFPGGRIDPEDIPTLVRLRRGATYQAFAWIPREGH